MGSQFSGGEVPDSRRCFALFVAGALRIGGRVPAVIVGFVFLTPERDLCLQHRLCLLQLCLRSIQVTNRMSRHLEADDQRRGQLPTNYCVAVTVAVASRLGAGNEREKVTGNVGTRLIGRIPCINASLKAF